MRTHFVIASVAWQSRRRSNGLSSTCVQPHRDCQVPRRARDERALLAMTDYSQRVRVFSLIEIAKSLDELGMSGRVRLWREIMA